MGKYQNRVGLGRPLRGVASDWVSTRIARTDVRANYASFGAGFARIQLIDVASSDARLCGSSITAKPILGPSLPEFHPSASEREYSMGADSNILGGVQGP